ncbi:hypothetical protein [Mangrovitalea sediminis]|uniref:hypothetical protein n=1 Tax=Mangrovitalea sediminis TaxID=1982043 RepID=UPI000BE52318|nr:hypothetical protein [Mangrovitalea sediminis]
MTATGLLKVLTLSTLVLLPSQLWAAPPPHQHDAGQALLGKAVPDTLLADKRGGHETTFNTNELNAKLYENQAIANVTGTNTISTSAFSGMSGYATVVQNSGNNVIIQNATILNVKLQ